MGLAMDGAIVEDRAPGFGTNNDALWAAQAYLTPDYAFTLFQWNASCLW